MVRAPEHRLPSFEWADAGLTAFRDSAIDAFVYDPSSGIWRNTSIAAT